ncbi:hypothetical protein I317_01638 [Kwoniella heveanensis CBS 569]|nr:hypothetical protein I317_01638 [Kwoniella heveanensis CBS 569]
MSRPVPLLIKVTDANFLKKISKHSGSTCEATQPAKIDKRRLRTLVDLATTEEQKQWVAEEIAKRGVYIASTDQGAVRKARPSAVGDPLQLIARLSPSVKAEGSSAPSNGKVEILRDGSSPSLDHPPPPKAGPSARDPPQPPVASPRRNSIESPSFKTTGLEPRHQDLPPNSAAVAKHDRRYGLFRVTDDWVFGGNPDEPMREGELADQHLREDVIAKLVHFYTTQIAPVNPVIPPHRVSDAVKSSPLVLASVVAVAALYREVPPEVYANVRQQLKVQLGEQVGGGSTLPQIQAMLISGMSHELHGDTNMEGGSNCWLRIGSAIRQAQDIGLHRLDSRHWLPDMYGGAYGQPLTINLLDCEDPLANPDLLHTPDLSHTFQSELYHVSCLLGNIMQSIYRPRGLERCTDQSLEALLDAIDHRISVIDNTSAFLRDPSSLQAGLLNLTISCTEVIFFRSFVKMNRKLPAHITFRPTPARWLTAVRRARTAIAWMERHGAVLLDCWLLVKYAITYSALAQYYHYAAERDAASLRSLSVAKDVMNAWALGHRQSRPIAARAKIADIVNIFFKAAMDIATENIDHPLAPTPSNNTASAYQSRDRDNRDPETFAYQPPIQTSAPAPPEPTLEAANTLMNMDTTRPSSSSGMRFDPSTLDEWLADVFRIHGASDISFMASAQEVPFQHNPQY